MKRLGVLVGAVILVAVFACDGECPVCPQWQEVVINEPRRESVEPEDEKPCEVLEVRQRRPKTRDSNIVVLEVRPTKEFDRIHVKFVTSDGGLPRILHIERDVPVDQVFEVEVPLPKCGIRYQVFVSVEGLIGDKLYTCAGSVKLIRSCVNPDPCEERKCGDCQEWNPDTCQCEGDCPTPSECDVPPEHSFSLSKPLGNPREECGFFDLVASGSDPAVLYITKCGLFYEVTYGPWTGSQCTNGQEVSHSTPCWCPEE